MYTRFARSCRLSTIRQVANVAPRTCTQPIPSLCRSFSTVNTTFLSGTNSAYVEEMYFAWKADPSSVHKSWDAYFKTGSYQAPPSLATDYTPGAPSTMGAAGAGAAGGMSADSARVLQMVRAFQVRGHLLANLDPIGLMPPRPEHEDLKLENYGFTEADLDRVVDLSNLTADVKGFLESTRGPTTLRQIYTRLQQTYCGTIGYEYMHIPSVEKCNWIRSKIETREKIQFSREAKLQVLDRLTWADHFEQFLKLRFSTAKRFGLEGAESFIAGMKSIISRSAELGVDNIVIGMPHRGRLNVLNTVVRKNLSQIFSEFEGTHEDDPEAGNGDVKYHLGMSYDRKTGKTNKLIHLSLLANPSHLEAVDPVVLGKTRAKQFYLGDEKRERVMGLLLHGDAAFAGQGVVWESLAMCNLTGYSTGGTVHIIVNNQVGFTTDPNQARSTPYCSDIAKAINAPIFHVNGDDPEAVVHVCELAAEWRAKFHQDVIIDLVCYRRHGHNEIDEPEFTQPTMYQKIKSLPSTLQIYQKRLLTEGITEQEIKQISDNANSILEKAYQDSKHFKHSPHDWLSSNWAGLKSSKDYSPPQSTGLPIKTLQEIGAKLVDLPEGFVAHPRIQKNVLAEREKWYREGANLDWGAAEALAFGSLLVEGKHVRLSGQDVERGTFSHRHAVLHDQKTNSLFTPLNNIAPGKQAQFTVYNSHLSEFGVLGFELGYSLENPHALVIWEAQFGDFFNTAQVIVDQFISSGEDKWMRQSGLTLLLPHGYEGQGPEHSSARIERFLQQSSDHPDIVPDTSKSTAIQKSNWQVINATTPANIFHALRRQLHREFRKPLIVFSPKSLLRHPLARSSLAEMGPGTVFQQVIGETEALNPEQVKRVVLCSGKVYYDLVVKRKALKQSNIAIVRVEQITPFPFQQVAEEISKYKNAEVVWVQEEPMNMGAWTYVQPRIQTAARHFLKTEMKVKYIGRQPSASTAAGHAYTHNKELDQLMKDTFTF